MEPQKPEIDEGWHPVPLSLAGASASNDADFEFAGGLPIALRNLTEVVGACQQMLDAPQDLPMSERALPGLAAGLRILESNFPGLTLVAARIECATVVATGSAAAGATVLALSRRIGMHLLYSLAIHAGDALNKSEPLDRTALGIFGAWCLRRLFDDSCPPNSAIAKVVAVLVRPKGKLATEWSDKARNRAHERALRNLDEAITKNEATAARYGLGKVTPRLARSNDPIDILNREFRRRVENLVDFASQDAVCAAGGYDTLLAPGLRDAGSELMARVRVGDKQAVLVCLEIITHLTSETTLKIPLQVADEPPKRALIWIDVRGGVYCQTLYRLIERGARPSTATAHLYEESSQIVRVLLSPPLREFLLAEMISTGWTAANMGELLGAVGHHPRSAVVGNGVYRCTARRLQESVPALLLDSGHHRWPVAQATNSHYLVSRGRPSYGTCQASAIDIVVNEAYRLLGWPPVAGKQSEELVGSFTTPKAESISRALNFLADEADSSARHDADLAQLVRILNCHAQWISLLLALGYALRRWLTYALPGDELRAGASIHFDDKDVHQHKGPPVPTSDFVASALCGWYALSQSVAASLHALGDSRGQNLADRMDARFGDIASLESVFTIDAAYRLEPVGCHTWGAVLPEHIRLHPSFARQFWPMQLMKLSVEQQLIDILMRHQTDGLHPGTSYSVKMIRGATKRLRERMDEVLLALALRMPTSFEGH